MPRPSVPHETLPPLRQASFRWRAVVLVLLGTLTCGVSAPARSNGDTFFNYAEVAGNPEYVYFGNVRDEQGHYLQRATVRVLVPIHQLEFTATTDVLGRYRTPDVGRAIKELGYQVNPILIAVIVEYPGYHEERRDNRARRGQTKGVVELNFRLARDRS